MQLSRNNVEIFKVNNYNRFLIDISHQVQGTIFPAPNFNPIIDAQMLGGALQGFGKSRNFSFVIIYCLALPYFKMLLQM
jgi:hypothetical protein